MPDGEEKVYIAWITIDPPIEHKIRHREGGGCTGDEVREAFVLRADVDLHWDDDEEHGRRVVGFGTTYEGRELFVALQPDDPAQGDWVLRTAFPM